MQAKQQASSTQGQLEVSGAGTTDSAGLQSQQAYGNAFLAEQLAASTNSDSASSDGAKRREGEASRKGDPAAELASFRSTKFAPLKEFRWGDDTRGLFDVKFDADSGTLTIDLRVAYVFKDGDPSKFPYFDPKEFEPIMLGASGKLILLDNTCPELLLIAIHRIEYCEALLRFF